MSSPSNTKTIIANMALSHIKQRTIASFSESSEQARKCDLFYDRSRRSALRACDWNFSLVTQALPLLDSQESATFDPTWTTPQDVYPGWMYLYGYPSNCIRLRSAYSPLMPDAICYFDQWGNATRPNDAEPEWIPLFKIVRSPKTNVMAVASQVKTAWAGFTFDITDESQFDDMFIEALALELAVNLAMPLTADVGVLQAVAARRDFVMGEAKRKNGGEGTERTPRISNYESARE